MKLVTLAVTTVVTLCDGNVTNRHDVTAKLSNMTVPLKTVTDVTVCDGLRPRTKTGQVKQGTTSAVSLIHLTMVGKPVV